MTADQVSFGTSSSASSQNTTLKFVLKHHQYYAELRTIVEKILTNCPDLADYKISHPKIFNAFVKSLKATLATELFSDDLKIEFPESFVKSFISEIYNSTDRVKFNRNNMNESQKYMWMLKNTIDASAGIAEREKIVAEKKNELDTKIATILSYIERFKAPQAQETLKWSFTRRIPIIESTTNAENGTLKSLLQPLKLVFNADLRKLIAPDAVDPAVEAAPADLAAPAVAPAIAPIESIKLTLRTKYTDEFKTIIDAFEQVKDIVFEFLVEAGCRKMALEQVCVNRRSEGYFINDSLEKVRNVINAIMVEKTKNVPNIIPPFVLECKDQYCPANRDCFSLSSGSSKTSSVIFDEIFKQFYPQSANDIGKEKSMTEKMKAEALEERKQKMYEELVVAVFCVFNISKRANNPPPIPYIDVNYFRAFIDNPNFVSAFDAKNEPNTVKDTLTTYLTKLDDDLKYFKARISTMFNATEYTAVYAIRTKTNPKTRIDKVNNIKGNYIKRKVSSLLTLIDNSNAASAVGTLEFVDKICKYNSTSTICQEINPNGVIFEGSVIDPDQIKKIDDIIKVQLQLENIETKGTTMKGGGRGYMITPDIKPVNIVMFAWMFIAFCIFAFSVYVTKIMLTRKLIRNNTLHTTIACLCIFTLIFTTTYTVVY